MSVASVARRVKIHEESAWRILAYHVNDAIARVDLSQLDTISVDEISVKYVAMDMSPAFISGASEYFPTAKIVFDKFHVIQMMNNTIDDVRRKEYKTNKTLGKTRFIWLKNPENLSDKEKKKLHLRLKKSSNLRRPCISILMGFWKQSGQDSTIVLLND